MRSIRKSRHPRAAPGRAVGRGDGLQRQRLERRLVHAGGSKTYTERPVRLHPDLRHAVQQRKIRATQPEAADPCSTSSSPTRRSRSATSTWTASRSRCTSWPATSSRRDRRAREGGPGPCDQLSAPSAPPRSPHRSRRSASTACPASRSPTRTRRGGRRRRDHVLPPQGSVRVPDDRAGDPGELDQLRAQLEAAVESFTVK